MDTLTRKGVSRRAPLRFLLSVLLGAGFSSAEARTYDYAGGRPIGSERVIERCTPAMCSIASDGEVVGSGVLIHADGVLLTNIHVISNCSTTEIAFRDGMGRDLLVEGILTYDIAGDWVAFKVKLSEGESRRLPAVRLGHSSDLRSGVTCIAIGNPLGLEHTSTMGIIASPAREIPNSTIPLIQHDATLECGSSGGGLFSLSGGLLGINCMTISASNDATGLSTLSFAIPIDEITLPQGDERMIPWDCFCSYLHAREPMDEAVWVLDWGVIRERAAGAVALCGEFVGPMLLQALADLNDGQPEHCLTICQNVKWLEPKNAQAGYLSGLAWLALDDLDKARSAYTELRVQDADLAADLLRELNLRVISPARDDEPEPASADASGTETDETPPQEQQAPDSDPDFAATLSPLARVIYDKFGSDGVRVYDLIDGVRTAEEILDATGLTEDYLVEILTFMDEQGIINLERPEEETAEPISDEATAETTDDVEQSDLAQQHRDVYFTLLQQDPPQWASVATLIREAIAWEQDPSTRSMDLVNLGLCRLMLGEPVAADSALCQAIRTAENEGLRAGSTAYGNRGCARLHLDRYAEAEEDFRQALNEMGSAAEDTEELKHQRIGHCYGLVCALARQGRVEEARQVLAEIVAVDPRWANDWVEYPEFYYSEEDRAENDEIFNLVTGD